ncbi:MAG: 1-(5-phosphoribosyl)-5-[(5-phosphoribosylamino)methylideneamino]imidazole-4-carboxamide isomerase [Prevotellaceae bacterium]|nr:1-(5-phosphoribosyl)-5-[(5-phosphoribosylamino)methylideneamino]imidazole-4-carboxamide isomerase [Prevotellaceae bacterium]
MIELIPAIDIIEGKCVRLTQGNYDTRQVYGDPVELAREFEREGFRRLHIVDLDGAKSHHVVNIATLREISRQTALQIDFGGGVKTDDDLRQVLDAGAQMATVGSVAVTHPELYLSWLRTFGAERLILGADVRDGKVSINGWTQDSQTELDDFLSTFLKAGTRNVLCTDICRDGTLAGPATELYARLMRAHPECRLIASGGVRNIADIEELEKAGVPQVVVGKALLGGFITKDELKERCWLKG